MSGTKMRQAREAARFVLNHLGAGDEFTLVDFDDGVTAFSEGLVPATAENVGQALKFVDAIEDTGGTNINDALLAALARMRDGDRPGYVLFLTDGLPTAGTTDTADILRNVGRANALRSRIFVFGVGDDVNTELLDRLSSDHRGTSVYIGETEDLERALSGFYEKISSPLLSDLAVDFHGHRDEPGLSAGPARPVQGLPARSRRPVPGERTAEGRPDRHGAGGRRSASSSRT